LRPLPLFLLLLVACSGSPPVGSPEPDGGMPGPWDWADTPPDFAVPQEQAAWDRALAEGARSCSSEADCVRALVTCCPCQSYGYEVAVSAQAAVDVEEILAACPEGLGCRLAVRCHGRPVVCEEGRCAFGPLPE
jgi:hypothetical protein